MMRLMVLLLFAGLVRLAEGYPNYTGYSGAPGRQTCASSCHGGSNGTVTVSGFPTLYTPGTPYTVTIARSSGNSIRNFNGSCRLGAGSSNAGVLSGGQGTSTYNVPGETNGIHLSTNGQNSASFVWTAPAAGAGTARLYIGAYQGSSANGQTTALTLVTEEGAPPDPPLAVAGLAVLSDDDGDGLAEGGEQVTLSISLHNTGGTWISGISGILTSSSPWLQLVEAQSTWDMLPPGSTGTCQSPYALVVDPSLPDDQVAELLLHVSSSAGELVLDAELMLAVQPPSLVLEGIDLFMDGDGDGVAEAGEFIVLGLSLHNTGLLPVTQIQGLLSPASAWTEMEIDTADWLDLAPGESAVPVAETPFSCSIAAAAPPLFDERFNLALTTAQGPVSLEFTLPVGARETLLETDLEGETEGWWHGAAAGWQDDWHLSTEDAASPSHSWKCGSTENGDYRTNLDARLLSPELLLRPWSRLSFQHRMDAETSVAHPDSAYDGGVVELSTDGGDIWTQVEPEGGYPHHFRHLTAAGEPTTHPFPAGTPCFSGSADWSEANFDLGAWAGSTVRLRFRFGSDSGSNREGWYLDDLRVVGWAEDTGLTPAPRPISLDLRPVWPNPFNPATTIAWTMPLAGQARLELFDVRGRLVRVLVDGFTGPGRHELRLEADGLASGAYLLRLSAAGDSRVRKLLLLR